MYIIATDSINLIPKYTTYTHQNLNSGSRRMKGLNSSSAAIGRLGPSGWMNIAATISQFSKSEMAEERMSERWGVSVWDGGRRGASMHEGKLGGVQERRKLTHLLPPQRQDQI